MEIYIYITNAFCYDDLPVVSGIVAGGDSSPLQKEDFDFDSVEPVRQRNK